MNIEMCILDGELAVFRVGICEGTQQGRKNNAICTLEICLYLHRHGNKLHPKLICISIYLDINHLTEKCNV